MGKIVVILFVVLLSILLFFPRALPRLLRRAGRTLRNVGRVGTEVASGEEEPGSALARYEVQAGELVLLKIMRSVCPCEDSTIQEEIESLGARLVGGARRREIPYRFQVIEDQEPNAFAVPGGAVFVTRRLTDLCQGNRDAIASIVGHEIAHIDLRHAVYNLGARAAARASVKVLTLGRQTVLRHLAGQIEDLLVQGYRRDQEFDADQRGAELAAAAGYDPRGFAHILRSLERLHPEKDTPFWQVYRYFRSHPPLGERIAKLESRFGR